MLANRWKAKRNQRERKTKPVNPTKLVIKIIEEAEKHCSITGVKVIFTMFNKVKKIMDAVFRRFVAGMAVAWMDRPDGR